MLNKQQIDKLNTFAEAQSAVVGLYVFGSVATGKNRRGSDLDLAIMTYEKISREERLKMETFLAGLLGCDVDLVVFGQSSPLLQHQILKYGRLLYEADVSQRVQQEVAARNAFLDTGFLYKEIR